MSLEWNGSYNWESVDFGPAEPLDWLLRRNAAGLSPQTVSRFLSKIKIISGECWLWLASRYPLGYGQFVLPRDASGRQPHVYAHRIAYELAHGSIRPDIQVRHRCDAPPCVNPDHLTLGTHTENMRDRSERSPKWKAPRLPLDDDARRRVFAECLSSRRQRDTISRLAREYAVTYAQLAHMVNREKRREFLVNATGSMSALR